MDEPLLIEGGLSVDDRGSVAFVNAFEFAGVKRFYIVANHRAGFVRAWHGHQREGKYVMALVGSSLVGAVKIDDWEHPAKDLPVHRYVLSAEKPSILYVPPGYANGFMTLTAEAKLIFFSTASLEDSRGDDIRYEAYYWNAWDIVER
jgi:dTDP-4-dehydrorhamnose 3,5-epimerase-like enzyme